MNFLRSATLFVPVLIVTGCAVGPSVDSPELATPPPATFVNAPSAAESIVPSGPAMTRWWTHLDDPTFDSLVDDMLSANLTLQEANERVLQAQARLDLQRGGNLPTISANADARRSFATNGAPNRTYLENYSADLNVSWTVDLFGQRRRTIEGSEASFLSTAAEYEALQHTLIAELLNRRVAVAINARLLELAEQNATNRTTLHDLVKRRYDLGVRGTNLSDVYLAAENLTSVQADVPQFARLLADDLYRLDLLLGQIPGTTQLNSTPFPLLSPPPAPPPTVPAALLDRRPDLRASELRARAATANVGIAIADLYPQLNLAGSLGVAGSSPSNLFSTDQLAGALLGSIRNRLFAGGALRANIRLQESAARELATRYANDVLNALREVESALQADQELARQLAAQEHSLDALRAAEALAETRYRNGIQTLRTFLDTQQRRYLTEQAWLRTQQLRWSTRISLHLALGGDWTDSPPLSASAVKSSSDSL